MLGAEWSRLPVIVLAAGRGRRMGGPKALMTVDGIPWWVHQSCALYNAQLAAVWVVSPEVRAAMGPAFEREKHYAEARVNGDPDAPMFESLRVGLKFLERMNPPGLFVLPVDVPGPGPEVFQSLQKAGLAAVPTFGDKHGHPVYLDWEFARTRVLPAAAGARLDELIAPWVKDVPVTDPNVAVNLNTPEAVLVFENELRRRRLEREEEEFGQDGEDSP